MASLRVAAFAALCSCGERVVLGSVAMGTWGVCGVEVCRRAMREQEDGTGMADGEVVEACDCVV